MVNAKVYDIHGNEKEKIILPKNFSSKVREDILAKVFEAQKGFNMKRYGTKKGAGAFYSATGILKHRRHDWKSTYGKGISRIPRKIMSRHGASFNWIGATVSNTRGGRRAHPPKPEKNLIRKINKKELLIAFDTALLGTTDQKYLEKKYGGKVISGIIFEEKILKVKTKDFLKVLKKLFGDSFDKILKYKKIRAGSGKMRGRKYKSNAGLLFVIGKSQKMKRSGIDVRNVEELSIKDLSPNGEPGRIACYTKEAIKEIEGRFK